MREKQLILTEKIENVMLASNSDLSVWYIKFHDLQDECYLGGEYILKISIPETYPYAPPDFRMMTPNGRFDVNKKLCFSNSGYHAESWSPLWNLKTIILGFLSFFLETDSEGIGHLRVSDSVKKKYAAESKNYNKTKFPNIVFSDNGFWYIDFFC